MTLFDRVGRVGEPRPFDAASACAGTAAGSGLRSMRPGPSGDGPRRL